MNTDYSTKQPTKGNQIVSLSEVFALKMLPKCKALKSIGEIELANQLFKSSTSVGANIAESQHAESKADFVHKLKIAAKEARESEFWMKIIAQSDIEIDFHAEAEILLSIQKLLSSIISTCLKSKF
ncbi:MAG: four helix bundle protein [Bacteroidetes bacterium]|nr:four helix bundle protein [Bacteroidota bacterium]